MFLGKHKQGAVVQQVGAVALGQHIAQRGAQRRIACVTRLQFVETARQLGGQARFVHLEVLQNRRQIGARRIEQLHEVMFDLNVVVRARDAQAGGGFQRVAGGVVQLSD